jgi:uncharacterized protein (DUF433 family)
MAVMETSPAAHIQVHADGIARVGNTRVSVMDIVLDRLAYGWSPEEIVYQHPGLSLGQTHAALSWYYDHQAEIDAQIEQDSQEIARRRNLACESPFVKRMRAEGHLP